MVVTRALITWIFLGAAFLASLFFNHQYSIFLGVAGLSLVGVLTLSASTLTVSAARRLPVILWLSGGFWLWWFVAAQFSPVSYASNTTVWSLWALPVAAFSGWSLSVGDSRFRWRLTFALLLAGVGLAGCAFFQYFFLQEAPRATFINKNSFAALEVMILLYIIGNWFRVSAKTEAGKSRRLNWLHFGLVGFLAFVIGLVGSLGATLALSGALVLLGAGACYLGIRYQSVLLAISSTLLGIFVASQLRAGGLLQKMAGLGTPLESSSVTSRMTIWSGSWEMLDEALWAGIGPGLYWLAYPVHRLPGDRSDGFYAHNDYLQFVIEAGLPALILFLLLATATAWNVLSFLWNKRGSVSDRVEALTLIAMLSAVCVHSLLTFNLYLMPVLMVCGLLIGRIAWLVFKKPESSIKAYPRFFKLASVLLLLLLIVPVNFYVRAIGGGWHLSQAMSASGQKDWQQAEAEFRSAIDYWPTVDFYHYSLAEILHTQAKGVETKDQTELLIAALDEVNKAKTLNPLRAKVHTVEARILETYDSVRSLPASSAVSEAYQQALEKNPASLYARFFYARYLLGNNHIEQGVAVLEDGLQWSYSTSALKLNYLRLTAEMRNLQGDENGYRELVQEVIGVAERLRKNRDDDTDAADK